MPGDLFIINFFCPTSVLKKKEHGKAESTARQRKPTDAVEMLLTHGIRPSLSLSLPLSLSLFPTTKVLARRKKAE